MGTRRALISVTDKTGIADFARALVELGFEILSTGGTRALLAESGVPATEVSEVTKMPEMLDGRVKTLHPRIHGGILARRDLEGHSRELAQHEIAPIDVVAVNLYAFESAARDKSLAFDEVVEQIDIGGPTLLRAAAKNHRFVLPVVDPEDYARVLEVLRGNSPDDSALRRRLALKVFQHTARYDASITEWLSSSAGEEVEFPERLTISFDKALDLRYGENPHQSAALYRSPLAREGALASARQLQGKPLSFNNLLDADSALAICWDLGEEGAVYVKHNNPCGAAVASSLAQAISTARACDPVSAFGAVVALGRSVDGAAAEVLAETFLEVILAPHFSPAALEVLGTKKNLRLLEVPAPHATVRSQRDLRVVDGGLLVQTMDRVGNLREEVRQAKVVTKRMPSDAERAALELGWILAKHVRSNAIVFSSADRLVAVGAGQMSRVDSVEICRLKGGEALRGTVAASDAFFPFRDGVEGLARAGATAVVQPGGSVRDGEVIQAADELGLAMLFTGVRHFRH